MDLTSCIPTHKTDFEAIQRARWIWYPGLNPILGELLDWMKDWNWPVAQEVQQVLTFAGPEIAPHINAVLRGDDEMWKYWTLGLLERVPMPTWRAIDQSLVLRIAHSPTPLEREAEVDDCAQHLLAVRRAME